MDWTQNDHYQNEWTRRTRYERRERFNKGETFYCIENSFGRIHLLDELPTSTDEWIQTAKELFIDLYYFMFVFRYSPASHRELVGVFHLAAPYSGFMDAATYQEILNEA